jgi:hypothetical protein
MWRKFSAKKTSSFFIYQKNIFHNFFSINIVLRTNLGRKKKFPIVFFVVICWEWIQHVAPTTMASITANDNRNKWEKIHWKSLQYHIELFIFGFFLMGCGTGWWIDLFWNWEGGSDAGAFQAEFCQCILVTYSNEWILEGDPERSSN